MKLKKKVPLIDQHDKFGFWGGKFGGSFIPETLKKPIEDLTINATNTLLKNLEETNHNTYVFLISHNLEKVLKTIQSRVFKFYFNPIL